MTIDPGRMMWLELKPVMRRIVGEFAYFRGEPLFGEHYAWRFSGTVEAPGLEGGLRDVIDVRDKPISKELAEALQAGAASGNDASLIRSDDGAVTLRGFRAAQLFSDAAA